MKDIIKPKTKRLSIELPLMFHLDIKARSAKQNVSISWYVQKALIEFMKKEKQQD